MKVTAYTPGSMYQRLYGSNMSRMNRQAVTSAAGAMSSYGAKVFDSGAAYSQGMSEIAAKQYAARITAEAKVKMQGAANFSSILQRLGTSA